MELIHQTHRAQMDELSTVLGHRTDEAIVAGYNVLVEQLALPENQVCNNATDALGRTMQVTEAEMVRRGLPLREVCQWWYLCGNTATTTRRHPALGAVPICARCDAKVEALA